MTNTTVEVNVTANVICDAAYSGADQSKKLTKPAGQGLDTEFARLSKATRGVYKELERKTYFKKLNHPEDIEADPPRPIPSYSVKNKTDKRLPIRNEFIMGNENDLDQYYWSNRIEVVDGEVHITPTLRRLGT